MKILRNFETVRGVLYIKDEVNSIDFERLDYKLRMVCKVVYSMPNDFAPDVDAKYCFWIETRRNIWKRISSLPEVMKAEEQ